MKEKYKKYINNDYCFDRSTFIAILCLIIVICGVFGFLYEFIFYYFNSGMTQVYWRGGNFLPWINIYATGAVMIFFLTYKLRKKPLYVFFISLISTGILEYISGWGMEKFNNGIKFWKYRWLRLFKKCFIFWNFKFTFNLYNCSVFILFS